MTMQAWHLSTISSDEKTQTVCSERNFCELGLNCAVFGPGSLYTCHFGAETMARWLANESCQEDNYLMAFQRGANLENCERYNTSCPIQNWNNFITDTKEYTNNFM